MVIAMKNGKCPKCGSNEIYAFTSITVRHLLPVAMLRIVSLGDYICCQCGFVETYLWDMNDIDKVKKHGKRITNIEGSNEVQ